MLKDQIQEILANWDIQKPYIAEQLKEDTARPVFKIKTDTECYILKGFSHDMPEDTIKSNVQAHLFLGNKQGLAPKIYPAHTIELHTAETGKTESEDPHTGDYYTSVKGYWFYLMEYIEGRQMQEKPEDEFRIGQAARELHGLKGYNIKSPFTQSKERFYVMQFVDFDHDTEEMSFRFDLALAFLKGYYGEDGLTREEYDLLFYGAEQMHISYMQVYGPYAVDSLWKILKYGIEQKEALWKSYKGTS